MDQNKQKRAKTKTIIQDVTPIILMLLGAAMVFLPFTWFSTELPVIALVTIGLGAIIGMFRIIKRDLSKTGRPSVLAILSILSWAAYGVAILLVFIAPGFYGYDLAILVNSMATIVFCGGSGIVLTSIALLW